MKIDDIYIEKSVNNDGAVAVDVVNTYKYDGTNWVEIGSNSNLSALADLADGKRTIFSNVSNDVPAGVINDIWIPKTGTDNVTYVPGEVYQKNGSGWTLATRYTEDLNTFVDDTYSPDSAQLHRQLDGKVEYYFYTTFNDNVAIAGIPSIAAATNESTALAIIDTAWNTQDLKDNANGNIVYFIDSKNAFWYKGSTDLWLSITDTSIYQALELAAQAKGAADGKVSQFYAWDGTNAPADVVYVTNPTDPVGNQVTETIVGSTFLYWLKDDNNLYHKPSTTWDLVPVISGTGGVYVAEGDVVTGFSPVTRDYSSYTYNGTSWELVGPDGIISSSEFFVDLANDVRASTGLVGSALAQLSIDSNTYTDSEIVTAQSNFDYNSILQINGVYYKSGFGLNSTGASTLTQPGGADGLGPTSAFDSEFYINAERFVLKSPSYPTVSAVFQVTSGGIRLGIDNTEATKNEFVGSWNTSDTFQKGDVVSYEGTSYTALRTTVADIPETSGLDWQVLAAKGIDGISGTRGPGLNAIPAYTNNDYSSITYNADEEALVLQSSDTSIGMAYPSFNVEDGKPYVFSVSVRASSTVGSGYYLRVYEYDSDLPEGKIAVSNLASNSAVQESTRLGNLVPSVSNQGVTTSYTTTSHTYTPSSTAKWASIVILNWGDLGTNSLYVKAIDRTKIGIDGIAGAGLFSSIETSITPITNSAGITTKFTTASGRTPVNGDVFTQTTAADEVLATLYDGSVWVEPLQFFDGSIIVKDTIGADSIVANAIGAKHLNVSGSYSADSQNTRNFTLNPNSAVPISLSTSNPGGTTPLFEVRNVPNSSTKVEMYLAGKLSKNTVDIDSIQEEARTQINPYYAGTSPGSLQEMISSTTSSTHSLLLPAVTVFEGKCNLSWKFSGSTSYTGASTDQLYATPKWRLRIYRGTSTSAVKIVDTIYTGWAFNFMENRSAWGGHSTIDIEDFYFDVDAAPSQRYLLTLSKEEVDGGTLTRITHELFSGFSPSFREIKMKLVYTTLYENATGLEDGDILLTEPYGNFEFISVTGSNNSETALMTKLIPVADLDRDKGKTYSARFVLLGGHGANLWVVDPVNNLILADRGESMVIYRVSGVNITEKV